MKASLAVGTALTAALALSATASGTTIPGRAPAAAHRSALPTGWSYCNQSDYNPHAAGSFVNMVQYRPHLDTANSDEHSLTEMSVQYDAYHFLEIGWSVDHIRYGDYNPHLFVGLNGSTTIAAYVPVSNGNGYAAGNRVTVGATMSYGIEYSGGAWWFNYGGLWFGYIPDTAVGFSGAKFTQVFGEVYNDSGDMSQMSVNVGSYYEAGASTYGGLSSPWANNGYSIAGPISTGQICYGGS